MLGEASFLDGSTKSFLAAALPEIGFFRSSILTETGTLERLMLGEYFRVQHGYPRGRGLLEAHNLIWVEGFLG
jgi:hypothetical protein